MTRLAFAADLHVDAYGSRIDPATGLNARLVDYLATTAWMAEEARRRGAEALVVAGDFTERRHPAPWLVSQIRGALSSFPGRQVYLRGNHDGEIAGGSIVTLLDDGFDEQDEAGRTGISRPRVSVGLGEFAGGRGIVDVAQEIREGQVVEERVHERQALCARLDELLEDTFAGPRDAQHVRALIEPGDRAPVAVVGLDQSADMLRVARTREGVFEELIEARAERLPFMDALFDHLTFTYLLRYVDDPAAAGELAEAHT